MTSYAPSAPHHWWSATWRIAVLAAIGMLFFIVGYGMMLESVPAVGPASDAIVARMLLDLPIGIVILVLYGFRRRAPLVIPCIAVALSTLSLSGAAAASVLVVYVASRRRPMHIATVALLYMAAGTVDVTAYPLDDGTPLWQLAIVMVLITGSLIVLGLFVGARRQLAETNARQRNTDEVLRIEQGQAQERARIAREMHDVLGHRLSLMAVHAGALEYRSDLPHEQTAQAAGIISENSRRALNELREVLGVLRTDQPAETDSIPQPVAADIPALIEDARTAGAVIAVEALQITGIPDTVGRHLFRIMQELLTNARKHAPGAPVTLSVTANTDDSIRLFAHNAYTERIAGEGFGLAGIAERVRLVGGAVTTSDSDGVFQIEAVLPWPK